MDADDRRRVFGRESDDGEERRRELVVFFLGGSFFGIEIGHVREIIRTGPVTPAPLAPDYVQGVFNLRGQIVTIVDLSRKLELDPADRESLRRYIVVEFEGEKIGLLVDAVHDVVEIDSKSVKKPPASSSDPRAAWVSGVAETAGSVIGILNLSKLLEEET